VAASSDPLSAIRVVRDARADVPAEVRRLGWISFWNDAASELVYPLVPLLLRTVLHANLAAIGFIEGAGSAVSALLRAPSGIWSDRYGRLRFVWSGYVMSSVAKPLLAIAPGWGAVLGLRLVDRAGKGLRTAPRDALIAEAAIPGRRGTSFGYHRALDTLGAVVGPLLAILLLWAGLSLRWAIAVAAVPAAVSLVLLVRVREPRHAVTGTRPRLRAALEGRVRWVLIGWIVFSLGNSSDAFLLLRGSSLGLSTTLVVLAYAVYNLVYASASFPAGLVSDRIGRRGVVAAGLAVFALAYAGFALAGSTAVLWPLFALYGLAVAMLDGVTKALVSDLAPPERVGSVMGVVTGAEGIAVLIASTAAGVLWDRVGPGAVFAAGAISAVAGMAVFVAAPLAPPRSG
jgi:MFS family permease